MRAVKGRMIGSPFERARVSILINVLVRYQYEMAIQMLGAGGERVASGKGQRFCDRMRGHKRLDLALCRCATGFDHSSRGWEAGRLGAWEAWD
jgi:hypothetical protein